jgi:hypothetical protein
VVWGLEATAELSDVPATGPKESRRNTMNKLTSAVAAVGLVLVASTPAFANRAGGPDTQNPITAEQRASAAANAPVEAKVVWAGDHREVEYGTYVDALNTADPTEVIHVGRLTFRAQHDTAADGSSDAVASSGRTYFVNG